MDTNSVLQRLLYMAVLAACVSAGQLMAAQPETLVGSKWRPIEITGKPVAAGTPIFLHFRTGGALDADGGCNRMGGSYQIDKANLRIGDLQSTSMACQGDVMALEQAFAGALHETRSFLREASKLTLKNAGGNTTMRLVQID